MNWEILGHEWAVNLLQEHVRLGQQRHAYLITGPPGIGRRTLALNFAQALNCSQPPQPGGRCGICRACSHIAAMKHPDLNIVQSLEGSNVLKVDEIRELQRGLSLTPYEARFRVALLLRFEEANPSAANALLKTLEEPSPRVVLILTAESAEMLLPTIVSRCEILRLRPLPVERIERGLREDWGYDSEKAVFLARISNGCPGMARRLAENPELLQKREKWLSDFHNMMTASRVERFAYVDKIWKDKEGLRTILLVWLSYWRDIMLLSAGSSSDLANPDWLKQISTAANQFGESRSRQVVISIQRTQDLIQRNVNARLALEVLMLDLPVLQPS